MIDTIDTMPNIGAALAAKLKQVGIDTRAKLITTGAENTFINLKTIDEHACLNMLYAIEGAIQGIRWYGLSKDRKQELKAFMNLKG